MAEALSGHRAVNGVAESVYEDLPAAVLAELSLAATWLVRTALAAGDLIRAGQATAAAERLAARNPAEPSLTAAAIHVRGLLDQDAQALVRAAALWAHPLAAASAAEDAGVAWVAAGDRDRAVLQLEQALAAYEQSGADRDVSRLKARLRCLGVRSHPRSGRHRPSFGWASLTEAEQVVAHVVAHRLSNREVADRLCLSPHTVDSHLRQIFRKLEISSRRELVGLLLADDSIVPARSWAQALGRPELLWADRASRAVRSCGEKPRESRDAPPGAEDDPNPIPRLRRGTSAPRPRVSS